MTEVNPYREDDTTLPMLVTLAFATPDQAHELIESIKDHGGVLVEAAGMHTKTVPCSVMDFRRWGGKSSIFPNLEDQTLYALRQIRKETGPSKGGS